MFVLKRNDSVRILAPAGAVFGTAREQLTRYLYALCGVVPAGGAGDAVPASAATPAIVLREDPSLGEDAYCLQVADRMLHLVGGNGRGVLYAVFGLCEYLGCRFYAQDTEVVPALEEIALPDDLCVHGASPFEYRDLYWIGSTDPAFCAKLRINGTGLTEGKHIRYLPPAFGGGIGYAGPHFVHTFEKLLPPETYFEEHPEYYALIDGERTAKHLYSQPCLSNPEVLRIMTEGVKEWLREHPEARIVSVSQNDSFVIGSFCTCPACQKINQEEGSPSGSLIRFVNALAEAIEPEFPEVAVDTLAYQYSTQPPKLTKPRHNVIVRMCTGGCSSHPIADCQNNAGSRDAIRGWADICDRLYIWDYTTDFLQYLNPYPNFRTLKPNVQFFAANHVKGVFEQGNYNEGKSGEFGELRVYLLGNLLWNPDFDVEAGTEAFLHAYYGGGAPYVKRYLDFLEDKVKDAHFNLVISAAALWNDRISDGELAMLDRLWADAYRAALTGGDVSDGISASLCAEHVERSGLCHRWFKLDAKRGEFSYPAQFEAQSERFYEDCHRLGVTRLSEGANVPWVEVK